MRPEVTGVAPSDLERLLQTERRLAERLSAARAERDRLIAEAEGKARNAETALAADLEVARQRLIESLGAERLQRERAIAAGADEQVARFDRTPPRVIAALAHQLATRFLVTEVQP